MLIKTNELCTFVCSKNVDKISKRSHISCSPLMGVFVE